MKRKSDICDHSFSQKKNLNTHVASVQKEKKQLKCDACNYCCFLKQHMEQHVQKKHEGKKNLREKLFKISFTSNQLIKERKHVKNYIFLCIKMYIRLDS